MELYLYVKRSESSEFQENVKTKIINLNLFLLLSLQLLVYIFIHYKKHFVHEENVLYKNKDL